MRILEIRKHKINPRHSPWDDKEWQVTLKKINMIYTGIELPAFVRIQLRDIIKVRWVCKGSTLSEEGKILDE